MLDTITLRAYAKINLCLDIIGHLPGGYHEMDMLMQSVSLHDTVTVRRSAGGVRVTGDSDKMPLGAENIAHRAATVFFAHTHTPGGADIHIVKRIPSQAGLGGGSADAAAVLTALNTLYETGLSQETLCKMGGDIGADIPFCLVGGTARVGGFGERVVPLPPMPPCYIALAKPAVNVSTAAAFKAFDTAPAPFHPHLTAAQRAVEEGRYSELCRAVGNTMQIAMPIPEVERLCDTLRDMGADCAAMTGSGSAVFGLFSDQSQAEKAADALREVAVATFFCHPVAYGSEAVLD